MKSALFIGGLSLMAFGFTSCKKDYTCTCTSPLGTQTYTYNNVRFDEADEACSVQNKNIANIGGVCTLDGE